MSRVFVRSRMFAPVESTPRTNIGTWTRILCDRRRSLRSTGIQFSVDMGSEINFPTSATWYFCPSTPNQLAA
jgi:hypothetical protein